MTQLETQNKISTPPNFNLGIKIPKKKQTNIMIGQVGSNGLNKHQPNLRLKIKFQPNLTNQLKALIWCRLDQFHQDDS